jgi:hypothetical protein
MSFHSITLNIDLSPIKKYIDDELKINCSLVPQVLIKKNGCFNSFCLYGFVKTETETPLLIISPSERKYIFDDVNIYNNNIEFKMKVKRNKTKFINNNEIIKLLGVIENECKEILRNAR